MYVSYSLQLVNGQVNFQGPIAQEMKKFYKNALEILVPVSIIVF